MSGHHARGAARVETCEHCREPDLRDNMVTPCQCYKKFEDCGWWHMECIKDHLRRMDVQETTRCPRCKKDYKIAYRFSLSCDRLLSCEALNHAFEMLIILFTLLCTAFAFYIVDWRKELDGSPFGMYFLISLGLFTFVLVLLTVRKVYMRWRAANSEAVLADDLV